jgi:anti-sigma-K factor RskA
MSNDETCASAAAYVLGALSSQERLDFEAHLAGCEDCRRTVAEFAGIPGLLSRISPADLAEPVAVPETLLPRLLREVRRRSRLRRVAALGAAAAVVLAVAGVGAAVESGSGPAHPAGAAFSRLVSAPISATAVISADGSGSRIDMTCVYDGATADDLPPYVLLVHGRDGSTHRVAWWKVGPDGRTRVVGSVDLAPSQIASLDVATASGTPVLRLDR